MKDYSKGKIYKIIDETNGDVYIGSTIQPLSHRPCHKYHDFNINRKKCKVVLIENYPCNSLEELLWRERYHIENNECVNKNRPIITEAERKKMITDNKNNWYKINGKQRYHYNKSWGGEATWENNLLMIDVNLFLSIH